MSEQKLPVKYARERAAEASGQLWSAFSTEGNMKPDEYQVSCGLQERPHFFAISGKKTRLLSLNLRVLRNNTDAIFGNFQTLAEITCSEAAGLRLSCNITPQGHIRTQYFTVTFLWTWSLFCIHSYEALSFYLYSELSTAGFPDRSVCSSLEFELSRSSKDPGSLNTIYPVEGYSSPGCAGEATAEVWLKIPPRSLPTNLCCYV